MTKDEFMALVKRYTEACDDMGVGLFDKSMAETEAQHLKASALWAQISAELDRLHSEAAKSERRAITFGDLMAWQTRAMRAAVVDAHLKSPVEGMQWIVNTLRGPGHLPDIYAANAEGGAQAMFDRETREAEAFRAAHPAP